MFTLLTQPLRADSSGLQDQDGDGSAESVIKEQYNRVFEQLVIFYIAVSSQLRTKDVLFQLVRIESNHNYNDSICDIVYLFICRENSLLWFYCNNLCSPEIALHFNIKGMSRFLKENNHILSFGN